MKIIPVNIAGAYASGNLSNSIIKHDIERILGFAPNISDDASKVTASWGFTVDGIICGIWDYKGSRWSTFGPKDIFDKLFESETPELNMQDNIKASGV